MTEVLGKLLLGLTVLGAAVGFFAAILAVGAFGLGSIGWALYGHFAPEGATQIGYWTWVLIGLGATALLNVVTRASK